jgi:hypothetical protein
MNSKSQSIIIQFPSGMPAGVQPPKPEWVRLPRDGEKETYSGLSRSTIWRAIKAGLVESKSHRNPLNPGAKRGIRLVRLASLLRFLEGGETADSATTDPNTLPPAA